MHRANQQPLESADGSRAKRQYQFGEVMAFACRAKCTPSQAASQGFTSSASPALTCRLIGRRTLRTCKRRHLSIGLEKISLDKAGLLMEAATRRSGYEQEAVLTLTPAAAC